MPAIPNKIIQFQVVFIPTSGAKLIYGLGGDSKVYLYNNINKCWEVQTENHFEMK